MNMGPNLNEILIKQGLSLSNSKDSNADFSVHHLHSSIFIVIT